MTIERVVEILEGLKAEKGEEETYNDRDTETYNDRDTETYNDGYIKAMDEVLALIEIEDK